MYSPSDSIADAEMLCLFAFDEGCHFILDLLVRKSCIVFVSIPCPTTGSNVFNSHLLMILTSPFQTL